MMIKTEMLTLAKQNGLKLDETKIEMNETGMDFVVAFAQDETGVRWVLRKPRRPDVWERAENEQRVLQFLNGKLPVEVPDWRIFTPELIAYPLLSGEPIAVVDMAAGGYAWRFEPSALTESFYDSLAETLAALHSMGAQEASAAGVRVQSAKEVREQFASNMEEVAESFEIPSALRERWSSWLQTDSYWPDFAVLHHGDLHPPHILVDDSQRVTGLIDWTEAVFGDPGKDFVIYYALFGAEGLRDLLERYERFGGKSWPRMHEHIAEQWAAYPAVVAKFALMTGKEADMEMAKGMIANWNV